MNPDMWAHAANCECPRCQPQKAAARIVELEKENLELQTRLGTTAVQLAISENKVKNLMQVTDK